MNNIKNIVVAVSLTEESSQQLLELKNSQLLTNADNVYFIHVYNKKSQSLLPTHVEKAKIEDVEEYIVQEIHKLRNELIPDHQNVNHERHSYCLYNSSEKLKVLDYLVEVKADLIIAPTRGEQGIKNLFQDSFCFWLVEHAPCNVLVIRPKKSV